MKQVMSIAFIFCFAVCQSSRKNLGEKIGIFRDPDTFRNVTMLISSKGYPVEDHIVQTSDGYLLSMQRIPYGRKGPSHGGKRQAVYLQHGILDISTIWVINFPEQSLGFILADEGYDVWLGNTRGNTYSKRHVKYSSKDPEFWDFSFDQLGQYDLPAMIDYVLNTTGEEKLYYIGHSQGTAAAFALLSESPTYNEKIKLFIALGPVAFLGHTTSFGKYFAPFTDDIKFFFDLFGVYEFLPRNPLMTALSEVVCETEAKFLCEDIMFILFGADRYQLNKTRLGVYAAHYPEGTSTRSVAHFGQLVNSKLFTKFDYGKKGNMEHYNQASPPEYDLSRITTPVVLLWGLNDPLVDPVDVHILEGKLKSLVYSHSINFPYFNHVDFCLALQARELVYDEILSLLVQY